MKFSLLALTALASVATADYYSVNFMPYGTAKAPTGAVTSTYVNPTIIDDATGNSCAQAGLIVLDTVDWIYYANCSGVAAHFGLVSGKSELEYVLNAQKDVYPCLEVGSGSSPVSFTNYVCSKTFTASKKITVDKKLSAPSSATAEPSTATITLSSATPASTCTSGFSGKRNGGGPTGACCTASNDCKASCHNGVCKTL